MLLLLNYNFEYLLKNNKGAESGTVRLNAWEKLVMILPEFHFPSAS